MDPLHIQDMFPKFTVNVSNTRGSANVLVVPLSNNEQQQLPANIIAEQSCPDISTDDITTTSSLQRIHTPDVNSDLCRSNNSIQMRPRNIGTHQLSSADEGLADLQPEDSDEEQEGSNRSALTEDQQKLEFMAALNLVPPAVMEEIQRRQQLCKAEYGNWWDRLHSTDFCLVPKTDSAFTNVHIENDESSSGCDFPTIISTEDQTHVAAGPDAGSLVEQITYLTSWPQSKDLTQPKSTSSIEATNQPPPSNTVEIATTTQQQQHLPNYHHHGNMMSHLHDDSLQATLQHITTTFVLPQD